MKPLLSLNRKGGFADLNDFLVACLVGIPLVKGKTGHLQ